MLKKFIDLDTKIGIKKIIKLAARCKRDRRIEKDWR